MPQQNPLIKEYLDITFRRKWWIILPTLVGLLFSVALFFRFPKLYRAETRVAIQDQTISKSILNPVIDFESADLVTKINGEITSEQYVHKLNEVLQIIGSENEPEDLSELGKKLADNITINSNRRDRYFTLQVTWRDGRMAASIANELAAIYIERNAELRGEMADEAVIQLRQKREGYEKKLNAVRDAIQKFRGEHKFELESFERNNQQQLERNTADIQRIDSDVLNYNDEIRDARLQLETQVAENGAPERDPRLDELQGLRSHLADLRARGFKDAYPEVAQLNTKIGELEDALAREGVAEGVPGEDRSYLRQRRLQQIERWQEEIEVLERNRSALQAENEVIAARLHRTPGLQIELNRLLQQEESFESFYQEAQKKEMKAVEGATLEDFQAGEKFRVLNSAVDPRKPFFPDLRLFLLMGLTVGCGMGIAIVLLLEVFDQSFKSEEQLAASIDFPILAVIPDLSRAADRAQRRGKTRVRKKRAS